MERDKLPKYGAYNVHNFGEICLHIATNTNMTPLQMKIENDINL